MVTCRGSGRLGEETSTHEEYTLRGELAQGVERMFTRSDLTAARLRGLLHYNPATGVWTAIKQTRGRKLGCTLSKRKIRNTLQIGKTRYLAARCAWLYMTGAWPEPFYIDHINGDPTDDRWCNLRLATQRLNNANARMRKNNTSGIKGVHWDRERKKWFAAINDAVGHRRALGRFERLEDAAEAYRKAAQELFGEFARCE